jgi:DNA-binding NtrC family response regulator
VWSVLLVEIDPVLANAWRETLRAFGHEVTWAAGIRDAIRALREGGIDVVILDVYESGNAVSELVSALDRLPDAPSLILVSGLPDAPQLSARIGAVGFVPKPCHADDLIAELARVMGNGFRPVFPVEEDPTSPNTPPPALYRAQR